jgi:hypothetical protein
MHLPDEIPTWDFSHAIDLLKTLSLPRPRINTSPPSNSQEPCFHPDKPLVLSQSPDEELSLGNFDRIWDFLSVSRDSGNGTNQKSLEEDAEHVAKEVRWRDEVSGADLEDNVDPEQGISAASVRTQKRAARRARAKERADKETSMQISSHDTGPDSASDDESGQELERLRRSPDRRALIQDILKGPSKNALDVHTPPTSPSPPTESHRVLNRDWLISNPFQWSSSSPSTGSRRKQILPLGDLSAEERKSKLIARLVECFPSEAKFLKNKGLIHPEFTPLNTSDSGVHVFVDISNVRFHWWAIDPHSANQ